MSFFTIVGMIITGIVSGIVALAIAALIINFIGYQKGARLTRDYLHFGPDRNQWFWTKHGVKIWLRSFVNGSNWYSTVADPEDDNYDLYIYENGMMVRKPARIVG